MKKSEDLKSGWTDVTLPIIGDEWQFIYKPVNDENDDSSESAQPDLMNSKTKKAKAKNNKAIIGKHKTKNPII